MDVPSSITMNSLLNSLLSSLSLSRLYTTFDHSCDKDSTRRVALEIIGTSELAAALKMSEIINAVKIFSAGNKGGQIIF